MGKERANGRSDAQDRCGFFSAFTVPGFDEALPAGEYEIETELASHLNNGIPQPESLRPCEASSADISSGTCADSDRFPCRPRPSTRQRQAHGRALSDLFLEDMLSDPMVQLVMKADGVSEAHLRHLFPGLGHPIRTWLRRLRRRPPEERGRRVDPGRRKRRQAYATGLAAALAHPSGCGKNVMADEAIAKGEVPDIATPRAWVMFRKNAMPAMRNLVLERRLRRTDLPTLQGVECLAERRARQRGRISPR